MFISFHRDPRRSLRQYHTLLHVYIHINRPCVSWSRRAIEDRLPDGSRDLFGGSVTCDSSATPLACRTAGAADKKPSTAPSATPPGKTKLFVIMWCNSGNTTAPEKNLVSSGQGNAGGSAGDVHVIYAERHRPLGSIACVQEQHVLRTRSHQLASSYYGHAAGTRYANVLG